LGGTLSSIGEVSGKPMENLLEVNDGKSVEDIETHVRVSYQGTDFVTLVPIDSQMKSYFEIDRAWNGFCQVITKELEFEHKMKVVRIQLITPLTLIEL
jgi:hypothetical protein